MATCLSNLRQMGAGLLMYAQDSDECLPVDPPQQDLNGFGEYTLSQNYGFTALLPYVKSAAIYDDPVCALSADPGVVPSRPIPDSERPVDYRLNENGTNDTKMIGHSVAMCTYPSLFFMIQDRHSNHHLEGGLFVSANQYRYLMPMVMADGHAKAIRVNAAKDRNGTLYPNHWNFPNCHIRDPLVVADYEGKSY